MIYEGSLWFKRFQEEIQKMSPNLQLRRIKHGFFRLYWLEGGEPAYIHEVYQEMPYKGYTIEEDDYRLESLSLYEEYEDRAELTRKIKNFVEGYIDSIDKVKRRVYMLRNDDEFRKEATKGYRSRVVR